MEDKQAARNPTERSARPLSTNRMAVHLPAVFIVIAFACACLYVILVRVGPHHLTAAFHWDEGFGVDKTLAILRAGSPSVGGFLDWGPLYFYLHAGVFAAFEFISGIIGFGVAAYGDYRPYIIVGRFVNLAAALGYSVLFYLFASKYGGRRIGVLALALFVTVPIHIQVVGKVRPDTLNLLFIIASLFFLAYAEPGKRRRLYLAAVFAALSFGVKYTGATLLPFICLATISIAGDTTRTRKKTAVRALKDSALIVAIFTVVVFITAPVFLLEPVSSFYGLLHLQSILKHGTSITGPPNPLYWLPVVFRPHDGGPILPAVSAVFVATAGISAAITKKGRAISGFFLDPKVLVFLWALAYAVMFILTVRLRASRYVIPLLPFYALSAALVIKYVFYWKPAGLFKTAAAILLATLLTINCVYVYKMFAAYSYGMTRSKAVYTWFAENVPEGETVGYSLRAYVPFDVYECVKVSNETELNARRPAAYVLNYRTIEEFGDPRLGRYFLAGEERFEKTHFLINGLFEGSIGGYYLAADLGLYYIFARDDVGPGFAVDEDGRKLDEVPTVEVILSSPEHRYEREFFGLPYAYRIYLE